MKSNSPDKGYFIRSLIVGVPLFIIVVFFMWPNDVFSTALVYDSQNINLVRQEQDQILRWLTGTFPRNASVEGVATGLLLALLQVAIVLKMEGCGGWRMGSDEGGLMAFFRMLMRPPKANQVNWEKMHYFFLFILVSFGDTTTDAIFKTTAGSGAGLFLRNWSLAYFQYTVGSELGIMLAMKFIVDGTRGLIGGTLLPPLPKMNNQKQQKSGRPSNPSPLPPPGLQNPHSNGGRERNSARGGRR